MPSCLILRRDAYEVCSLIPAANERAQCYSVFGVDSTRMLEYYETVLKLEEELETQTASRSGKCCTADPFRYS